VYVDLNMVRAGAMRHPREWREAGYHETQNARRRYRIIDRGALSGLLDVSEERLATVHGAWFEGALGGGSWERQPQWSEAVAVGGRELVEEVQRCLGARGRYRVISEEHGTAVLREAEEAYASISRPKWAA
jgi:putative transposase